MRMPLICLSLVAALLTSSAMAADPVPAPAAPAKPNAGATPATPTQSAPVRPASAQATPDATLEQLTHLAGLTAVEQARLGLDTLTNQRMQMQGAGTQGTPGVPAPAMPPVVRNGEPVLVGLVSGKGGNLVAEFIADGAMVQAAEGDWVTPKWRVRHVNPTSVELARSNGRTRVVMLGGRGGEDGRE